jgi:hypothetical protein
MRSSHTSCWNPSIVWKKRKRLGMGSYKQTNKNPYFIQSTSVMCSSILDLCTITENHNVSSFSCPVCVRVCACVILCYIRTWGWLLTQKVRCEGCINVRISSSSLLHNEEKVRKDFMRVLRRRRTTAASMLVCICILMKNAKHILSSGLQFSRAFCFATKLFLFSISL